MKADNFFTFWWMAWRWAASLSLWPAVAEAEPLLIGGIEFSRNDDIDNMEKLSNLFGQAERLRFSKTEKSNGVTSFRDEDFMKRLKRSLRSFVEMFLWEQ